MRTILVLVCVGVAVKRRMYQRKVDVDNFMLNFMLADVSSVSPSSKPLYGVQHIHMNLTLTHSNSKIVERASTSSPDRDNLSPL